MEHGRYRTRYLGVFPICSRKISRLRHKTLNQPFVKWFISHIVSEFVINPYDNLSVSFRSILHDLMGNKKKCT